MVIQGRLDENLGLRHPVGREIMIREGAGLIGIVEENHRPGAFHVSLGLDQLRGRAPYRHYAAIHERLHRGDQGVEVDPQRRRRLVEARDGGNSSLVECTERRSCGPHEVLLGKCREKAHPATSVAASWTRRSRWSTVSAASAREERRGEEA